VGTRWIGLDVGGSAIKAGAIAADGSARVERTVPVPSQAATGEMLDLLADAVRGLATDGLPPRLGVGVPGLLDRERGRVLQSPNLPWLAGAEVRTELAHRLALPTAAVLVENDANVAAQGELWLGAARGQRHALVVTLGTGIGGGVVLDGELFVGQGLAGEIGHVVVDPAGPRCGCGARGCLETLASASAASRRARERSLPREAPGDLELLAARARAGAPAERELLAEVGADLGRGLACAVALLDVRTFVLGGGFSAALDTLEQGIRRGLGERAYGQRVDEVKLVRASLGASAGWIGAASLCLRDSGRAS
jgi:glucokinase